MLRIGLVPMLALLGWVFVACGSEDTDEQAPIAAQVGDVTITQVAVQRQFDTVWPMSEQDGGKAVRPPRFDACVNARRAASTRHDVAMLRRQCKEVYKSHLHFAVSELLQLTWSRLAARSRGVEPSQAALERIFDKNSERLAPAQAEKMRASARLTRASLFVIRRQERVRRLTTAFRVTDAELPAVLARRYKDATRCAPMYVRGAVPECTGELAGDVRAAG
jgi:hypothetical protein